ncbi:MAG TPA: ABC transporter permease subunit [Anaerolineae bacterium]
MQIPKPNSSATPFWRDVRVLRVIAQILFVVFVLLFGLTLCNNLTRGLGKFTSFSFDFLTSTSSLPLSETTIPYDPHDPMYRAYIVGLLNTLRVVVLGIVLASILGLVGGIARLSSNWLISKIAAVYVEIFIDTPLLIQLYFWYIAGVLRMPRVRESIQFPGSIFLSNRGLVMPWYDPNANFWMWVSVIAVALGIAVVAFVLLGRAPQGTRARDSRGLWLTLTFLVLAVFSAQWLNPFDVSVPSLQGFNFEGGITLSGEYVSILLGLVLYTGAFITEIVRAGIQAVPRGVTEASRALGLTHFQALRLVTIPLALRVIIPPLTNQFLNLAKNSSLASAVAFPDLFFVGGGIYNMTGQTIQVIAMMMGTYLLMSLAISAAMNALNARFKLVER